ncbi:MAG TPA: amino acid adenylation domain-containing protein, partial [Candidatus Dormibacteraeota bacterium]|nr:amino acid adenylation domain-containing protein [Candidatus Dormibacteraeota bacterium]
MGQQILETIPELLERAAQAGVFLSYQQGGLHFRLSVDAFPEPLKLEIAENKAALIAFLKQRLLDDDSTLRRPAIAASNRAAQPTVLSFAQERLWFIDQLDGGSVQYNMPAALRVRGSFDEEIAERALVRIIQRHEPLRTVFINGEDSLRQYVQESFDFCLTHIDLSALPKEACERAVLEAVNADAIKPFDLKNDLMLRASFLRIGGNEGVLLFNMHHIASDGWSLGVLVNEFGRLYEALSQGKPDPLLPLAVQYADYAQWQRNWLEGEVLERQLSYWERQLADLPQLHGLLPDRPRPAVQTFNGALHTLKVEQFTLKKLKDLALHQQATLFMVLHASFALLLSRHANSSDIVIGTAVANRQQKELEQLVGFFVNTLVLRTDCSGEQTFREFLDHVRNVNLDAQVNQDVPFEHLVERLKPHRSTSHAPLFQIMFNMTNSEAAAVRLPGVTLTPLDSDQVAVKFDLVLEAMEQADGLKLSFAYSRDLFDASTIVRLGEHLRNLLRGVVANPDGKIETLPLLAEAERHHLLHGLNETAVEYPQGICVHELFEAQVESNPKAIAVVYEDRLLNYQELNAQANQLAHYLRAKGLKPDETVAICAERSFGMIVALLGVLKAGGGYVPLDPRSPVSRLRYMLEDSEPVALLTQPSLAGLFAGLSEKLPVIHLQQAAPPWSDQPKTNLECAGIGLSPEHLAYVIYTSGSTGLPKGVVIEHRNLSNLVHWHKHTFGLTGGQRASSIAGFGFDAAAWEIWSTLSAGATLVMPSAAEADGSVALLAWWERQNLDLSFLPTPMAELAFTRDATRSQLHTLLIGGDRLSHLPPGPLPYSLVNNYGPTEATVVATSGKIAASSAILSIGRPIANTRIYILDGKGQPVPMGVAGELYIAGAGVGRCYLNRPELTAERFLIDPFVNDSGARMYRSGDMGRWLQDGTIEFLGRNDFQVKIRGFRIELGEIEHQLAALPEINTAVVVAREDAPGEKRLVAYVTLEENVRNANMPASGDLATELRRGLQSRVPDYMVPSAFVVVDALPLTPNGKVDRKALPAPNDIALAGTYVAPETETEIALARIWGKLVRINPNTISAAANFFELGGHSLLSIRLLAQIRAQLGVELQIRDVFDRPQLSSLAAAIAQNGGRGKRPRIVASPRETYQLPASFAQQRLWFIDQLGAGSVQYNMPGGMRVRGRFDEEIAERVLARIIQRHEPLRTVIVGSENGPLQSIRTSFDFHLARIDLSGLVSEQQERAVTAALNAEVLKPFDLTTDLMLRASFVRLSEEEGVLLLTMHHIASDGWSLGILVREFVQLYESFSQGRPDPLPPLVLHYADYAQWQRNWLQGEALEQQLSYWEKQLADLPQVHGLPLDRARPAKQSFDGAQLTLDVDRDTLDGLKQLALREQATLFMVLHGVFALLLSRHARSHDVVVGTPVANRPQQELEPLVGFFVNTLVLRADCSGKQPFRDYLAQIKRVNLEAQTNQDVPFEHLVERLKPHRSASHTPLFQIMFTMNTNEAAEAWLPELTLTPLNNDQVMVKFDLILEATERADGLRLNFAYSCELFNALTIARLGEHMENLLRGVVANPFAQIQALLLITEAEHRHLLYELNDTAVDYPREICLHELFEEQVERSPEAEAVVFEDRRLNYRELNGQANQLAH